MDGLRSQKHRKFLVCKQKSEKGAIHSNCASHKTCSTGKLKKIISNYCFVRMAFSKQNITRFLFPFKLDLPIFFFAILQYQTFFVKLQVPTQVRNLKQYCIVCLGPVLRQFCRLRTGIPRLGPKSTFSFLLIV